MTITTKAFRLAITSAALCAAVSTAYARPKRIVIQSFDGGTPELAEAGRKAVTAILGDEYELVPSTKWEQARATAAHHAHGPDQWARAAKASGVGAIVEGSIQEEGRRKILTITVREADTGKERDPISVRLDTRSGLSAQATKELQTNLDQLLEWIQVDQNETPSAYPAVSAVPTVSTVSTVSTGTKHIGSSKSSSDDTGEETVGGKRDDDSDAPRKHVPRSRSDDRDDRGDDRRADRDDRRGDDRRDDRSDRDRGRDDRGRDGRDGDGDDHDGKVTVAAAEPAKSPEVHDLSVLFPGPAEEQKELNPLVHHISQPTPRFSVDAGLYYATRSLQFNGDSDSNLQQLEGLTMKGFQVNAAVFPWPTQKMDGQLSGLGFTGQLRHSLSSTVDFDDGDEIDTYNVNQSSYEIGIHYRLPLNNLVTFDGGVFYGSQSIEIEDASEDFEIPDTKYTTLGASVHLDLNVTERATIGLGARYFAVTDEGMLASTDWFGPTSASGLGFDASFVVPLPKNLYLRGQVEYQKISMTMSGGGIITDQENVTDASDTNITAMVDLGIGF